MRALGNQARHYLSEDSQGSSREWSPSDVMQAFPHSAEPVLMPGGLLRWRGCVCSFWGRLCLHSRETDTGLKEGRWCVGAEKTKGRRREVWRHPTWAWKVGSELCRSSVSGKHSEPWQWHKKDIEVGILRLEEAMSHGFGWNPEGVQARET